MHQTLSPAVSSATQSEPSLSALEAQEALARACGALWLATLSLMTAYMQQQAPAHRHLLARRIARNLHTLQTQDCYSRDCRERFARLALRWERNAARCGPQAERQPWSLRAFLFGTR